MDFFMLQDEVLHLFAAELLAAAVDRVLDASHDDEAFAAGVHRGQVSRAVETVLREGLLIVVGGVIVTAYRIWTAEDYLSGTLRFAAEPRAAVVYALRDQLAGVLVDNLPFVGGRDRKPDRIIGNFVAVKETGLRDGAFGHAKL